jgi:dehydrogenase/reductase SDR family member 12
VIERLVDAALELSVVGSYSRIGYAVRSRLEGWLPPPRVDGRVALVTGGTSGIGRAIASSLAGLGASVVVVGRDQVRGIEVAREIVGASGNEHVSFERADLSDLSAVRDIAARVARTHDRLDVLVHNAGVLGRDYQRTDDGLELTVAVHVVGPFLLTQMLLPLLQASDAPRVITMSSGGMYTQRLDVGALDPIAGEYDGVRAYARAKRAQVELTRLWEQHEGPTGVRFVSMHPGWVATPGIESSLPSFNRLMRPILRTAEEGADTAVWLAASPDSQLARGRFWLDRHPRGEHRVPWTHAPPGEAARLWAWCTARAGGAPASAPEIR